MAGKPRKIYRPNYAEVYPGIDIDDAVMDVLKRSDRKMEYQECDIKYPRAKRDKAGKVVGILPPRENSYDEHLEYRQQFKDAAENTEQAVIDDVLTEQLLAAMNTLDAQERELIHALFYQGMTERKYAEILKISNIAVHKRKIKILGKLKIFLNSG